MAATFVNSIVVAMLAAGTGLLQNQPQSCDPTLFSTQMATIQVPSVDLHADASHLQPVVGQLVFGERAVVIFVQGDWYKVRNAPSCEGWVERANTSTSYMDLDAAQIRNGTRASLDR
jgi:hypothetical protein